MHIHLTQDGLLIFREADGTLLASLARDEYPGRWPALPAGCAAALLDDASGKVVGYDLRGNALPGAQWPDGAAVARNATAVMNAHHRNKEALAADNQARRVAERAARNRPAGIIIRRKSSPVTGVEEF